MSFLHQQTRVKCDPQNRLVELRNNRGETPLLRASCVGKVPSLKVRNPARPSCIPALPYALSYLLRLYLLYALLSTVFCWHVERFLCSNYYPVYFRCQFLLDSNSDPFVVDLEGNSIFINLTRCGCIWGLHYVYSYLRSVVDNGYTYICTSI